MWTVVAILLIAWLVAMLASVTFGGWIHLLPLLAVILAAFRLFRGWRQR